MEPSRNQVKKLKDYDGRLRVDWDNQRERFVVSRELKQLQNPRVLPDKVRDKNHIFQENGKCYFKLGHVENADGTFRDLDERVLLSLKQRDLQRKNLKNLARQRAEANLAAEKKASKKRMEEYADIAGDMHGLFKKHVTDDRSFADVTKEEIKEYVDGVESQQLENESRTINK